MRSCDCAAVGLRVSRCAQETAKHAITFDDMMKLHRIAEPQVSRDGNGGVHGIHSGHDTNRGVSNIWVVPTAGGAAMQLDAERARFLAGVVAGR